MASENDSILGNNFDKTSINYNNNETETSSTSSMSEHLQPTGSTVERRSFGGTNIGDCRNIRATSSEAHTSEHMHRREENPFSFKHFLNRDSSTHLGSTSNNSNSISNSSNVTPMPGMITVTALSNESHTSNSSNNNIPPDEYNSDNRSKTIKPLSHTVSSTAATLSTTTAPSSSSSSSSYQTSTGARPKVPLSNSTNNQQHPLASSSVSTTSMSSLIGETSKMKRSPRFSSFDSQASLAEFAGGGNSVNGTIRDNLGLEASDSMCNFFFNEYDDRQYVHRSYSNYDMDLPPKNSNNCTGGVPSPRRRPSPTRTTRHNAEGLSQSSAPNKLFSKNQTSPTDNNGGGGSGSGSGGIMGSRPNSEFPSALPDFVQDHLMDQWYDVVNYVDFVEDLPAVSNLSEKNQTLPDFLSDGPIIHSSSSHLADVAAGLPDLDSPEDNSPSLQISRLRLENERLRRELDESRLALAEQTRRAGELERRLEQAKCNESAYNRTLSHSMGQVEENLDQSKKRAAAAQSQITKLKQQVKQLTAENDTLRRENESLREEGAVGGDRITRRPSRTQQLSRDLMRAASNAENNLRQLLSGVENLRLMAATIENMDRIAYDPNSVNINEEYLSDCDDDYEDFSGPAL